MNLHQIVSGAIGTVNPLVYATLRMSTGYTVGQDGTPEPAYADYHGIPAQIQALTYSDLQKISGLNIQGTRRAIYVNGKVEGLDRNSIKGGDLFTFPDGTMWLVAMVLEAWPDWTKVAVTQQVST
ncbi:MAG: hypothetical protein P4L90_26085 [Rhodopila sp.]|nr:hypothetical protein [Rhodopila sp.]